MSGAAVSRVFAGFCAARSALLSHASTTRSNARRIVGMGAGIAVLLASAACPPLPRLVWNASASAPVGLYGVSPGAGLQTGDMVVARLLPAWRDFAAARRYLPANIPVVKRIAAQPGDEICAIGDQLYRNRVRLVARLKRDGAGRLMPWWTGCIRLRQTQFLLLMTDSPASFDGRYFGATGRAQIIGRARLIWSLQVRQGRRRAL